MICTPTSEQFAPKHSTSSAVGPEIIAERFSVRFFLRRTPVAIYKQESILNDITNRSRIDTHKIVSNKLVITF